MSIVAQIFQDFVQEDKYTAQEKKEMSQLMKVYSDLEDRFLSQLPDEERLLYLNLDLQRCKISGLEQEHMFCCGFRIGVQLILETTYPQA